MAKTDVELVIKARNEASSAVLAIADALKVLSGAQDTVAQGGRLTSSVLDQLRTSTTSLTAAFTQIDGAANRAERAFAAQTATLAETQNQLAAVTEQAKAAEAAMEKMNAAGPPDKATAERLKAIEAAQRDLAAQASRLTASITNQESALDRNRIALQQVGSTANAAEAALKSANETTAVALERNATATRASAEANQAMEIMALEAAAAMDREAASARAAADATVRVATALPPIAPAAQEAANAVNGTWTALRGFLGTLLQVPDAERRAEAAMLSHANSSRSSLDITQRLRAEVLSLAQSYIGLYAAVNQVRGVVETYISFQSAQNRLSVVFGQNVQAVGAEIAWLRDQSLRLGVSFSTLSDEYSKFAIAAQAANVSSDNTRKIFLAVAEAARVAHLSNDQLSGVFLALTQMMSKGKVMSEELRRQLGDRLPGAFQIFADALGVSTSKLDKLMSSGQVLANEDNMVKFADELTRRFGPQLSGALESAAAQMGRFQAELEIARLQIANGGFMKALIDALADLNKFFQSKDGAAFFTSIGTAMGKLVSLVPIVAKNFDLITLAFKAWLTFRVSQFFLDLYVSVTRAAAGVTAARAQILGMTVAVNLMAATSNGAARVALTSLGAAMVSLQGVMVRTAAMARALWVAIGGFPGLVITAITYVVASLAGQWLTGVDNATAALDEHQRILTAVQQGYADAGDKVDKWAQKIKDVSTLEIKANTLSLQNQLGSVRQSIPFVPADEAGADDKLYDQLDALVTKFYDGKIAAADFKKQVNAFGEAHPEYAALVVQLEDSANKAAKLEQSIAENNAALHVLQGRATDADRALLGLSNTITTFGGKGAGAIDAFSDALDRMRKTVPDLKKQLQFDTDLTNAKEAYDAAVKAATTPAQLADAKRIYDEVVAKIRAYAAADQAKYFPLDNKNIIERIIYVESGGNPYAKNGSSTATGIGQFTEKTWLGLFDQVFPQLTELNDTQKLALRFQEDASRKMLEELVRQNQASLVRAGIAPTPGNTYLANFMGANGAIRMILANPNELAAAIAGKDATRANPTVLGGGKTAGDVLSWANGKMGGGSPITGSGATEAEQFNQALNDRIKAWQEEAAAVGVANTQKERALVIEKAIQQAQLDAAKAQTTLSDDQKKQITETVGALYDAQHAAETAQKAVDQAIGLSDQRETAIQELRDAIASGESADVIDQLKAKIQALSTQIGPAVEQARDLAAALGGDQGERMVASLDKVIQKLKSVKVGLTDAKQINQLLANGLTNAWDQFSQSVAQGKAVLASLRDAFLQFAADFLRQIAMMILKQTLLNLLGKSGVGGWISNLINGVTDTGDLASATALTAAGGTLTAAGGVLATSSGILTAASAAWDVTAASIAAAASALMAANAASVASILHGGGVVGSGGSGRSVAASVFAGARRFHGGGIPGLRPNEVPTILERGEEVLRRDNPRHILNGGGKAGSGGIGSLGVKIVNAIDAADFFSKGLNTAQGERTILNFIRANAGSVNAALK